MTQILFQKLLINALQFVIICYAVAIAEVYKNQGNQEFNKNNFNNAIDFYTEGIKVNCNDDEMKAKLYSNRAAAHFNLGRKLFMLMLDFYLLKMDNEFMLSKYV